MSIKQGDYLKELRIKNNLSQEKLGEHLGVSRQSVSKWEQGYAMPDTDNLLKLSELYNISVDNILKCGETEERLKEQKENISQSDNPCQNSDEKNQQNDDGNLQKSSETEIIFIERPAPQKEKKKKKRGPLFIAYPYLMVAFYIAIGVFCGVQGWIKGWLLLLTIPLFYTGIIAVEKKKPVIFCYPVLIALIYLIGGFFFNLWHPYWIVFLTIPIFYILAIFKKGNK